MCSTWRRELPRRFDRPDPGRNRHREGTPGQGHPLQQPSQGQGLCHDQLRRHSEGPDRVGTLRTRQRLFHGALASKRGLVEQADGGSLFLDEIGELPLELQVKVLRLIQQGEVAKVGAMSAGKVDVRVIAATHRNLHAMVEDGTFREDLYYRLTVIPLELPPLRDRPEDIPELVQHFFVKAKEKHGRPELKLPPSLLPCFACYTWPGNVRELENIVERLVVLTPGNQITVEDLPEFLRRERPVMEELHLDLPPQGISLEAVEKELILSALKKFNWNQTHAARYLDLSRKTLIYRMEKYNIQRDLPDDSAVGSQ